MTSESILPASQQNLAHHEIFNLTPGVQISTQSFVHSYTWRKAHWGDHTHTVPAFSRILCCVILIPPVPPPSTAVIPPHNISLPILVSSWQAMCLAKCRGAARVLLQTIFQGMAMVSNMQTQFLLLPCYYCTVLSQFWPPLFNWLGTG